MPMERLPMNRCLAMIEFPLARRLKVIEREARRAYIKEKLAETEGGRNFYTPFWSDAKRSLIDDQFDLKAATAERIAANRGRRNLYPRMLNGFLRGWTHLCDEKGISGPLKALKIPSVKICGENDNDTIRIDNFISIIDEKDRIHIIYPYLSKDVALGARCARIAIGIMIQEFEKVDAFSISVFDVIRGNLIANDEVMIDGSERDYLVERYGGMMREWRAQKRLLSKK
jgi:hypothetical protein